MHRCILSADALLTVDASLHSSLALRQTKPRLPRSRMRHDDLGSWKLSVRAIDKSYWWRQSGGRGLWGVDTGHHLDDMGVGQAYQAHE